MKKLLLFVLCGLFMGTVSAQDENGKLKNEGNAALRAKNYKEAFAKYEQYLKAVEYKDPAIVFNTAFCADKIKDYAAADKYFTMSIQNKYKLASAYLGKANALQDQKKIPEMLKTLEEGMKANPGQAGAKLEKMYAAHYLKEGQKFQKENKVEQAAECYAKITQMANKGMKTNGYLSLGTLYFNNGATILQKAHEYATTEVDRYNAEKTKALNSFKKAQDYLVQASSLSPENPEVKEAMKAVKEAMAPLTK